MADGLSFTPSLELYREIKARLERESMFKIYVAGPMTGLPEYNYPAFNAAASELKAAGYEPINPVDVELEKHVPGQVQEYTWYLRRGLRLLLNADGVALLPGWENSNGAKLEVHVAEALGMECYFLEQWLQGGITPGL